MSIIVPAHNQAGELRRHLPRILEQEYNDFEVIVVDIASTDETKDILEALELTYPQLRHTHTPASARDISLERLAMTLGLRASRHEWVVLTRADCEPATSLWLRDISEAATDDKGILLGVAKYDEQRQTWFDVKVGFFRLWNTLANLRHMQNGNPAVRADECNVAIRRSLFLQSEGFGEQTNLLTGAAELLVNRLSTPTNTAVVTAPEAIVIQDNMAASRLWKQHRVFYMETRRHQLHTFSYRTKQNLRMMFPWAVFLLLASVWPVMMLLHVPLTSTCWIALGSGAFLLLLLLIFKIISFNRAAQAIGYRHRFIFSLPILALALPLWNASAWIAHRLAPRNEFRKKFV
ncbi:MAG: glycosyltransferase [Bacteroidaceae bacterium]|nr:glycosyltransferase [Bacteroidaceae bacterium]